MSQNTIIYTKTDEAPALATESLLPIVKRFTQSANIQLEVRDISLAGRIIAAFPEKLTDAQKQSDDLAYLGDLAKTPNANIIKLPNISASIPQLQGAIAELKSQGYDLPDFPEEPKSDEEQSIRARYAKILGSAVNPVLREGNSDRRVAGPVKAYAQKNPHSMGAWSSSSKSHVAHMNEGDFYAAEKSHVCTEAGELKIEWRGSNGESKVLRESVPVQAGEMVDATFMSCKKLVEFFEQQIQEAKEQDVLLSLHMKATMMKVSDPIIFGHAVKAYYSEVFKKYAAEFEQIGVNANNGIGDVYAKIDKLDAAKAEAIRNDLLAVYETRPALAMVNSDKGITNLHVPSDVIIDASMPAAIRTSGQMWGPDGNLKDMKAMIPDRCYARMYQQVIEFCRVNGAFDVTTMGNVSNVGLMAQKAEEYGSHDKTFEIEGDGQIVVTDHKGQVVFEHTVEQGDIWRMCQTKEAPIKDWVALGVRRARATGAPAVFWLDENRAHDRNLIEKVNQYLPDLDTSGLTILIKAPIDAVQYSMEQIKAGNDVISVTGNVLRDYLTDLFPILELGTSAKMLSIVPLLAGGGLFETGAGGSAPKHVEQLVGENHLRWDSLGEFLAIAVSLEDLGEKTGNNKAKVLAETLNQATSKILDHGKSPSRKVKELDNRGSHFYLAMYWAQALTQQDQEPSLKEEFQNIAEVLTSSEQTIVDELNAVQGQAVDMGGYFRPDATKVAAAMRPSATFNGVIN